VLSSIISSLTSHFKYSCAASVSAYTVIQLFSFLPSGRRFKS